MRSLRAILLAALAVALAAALTACGSSSNKTSASAGGSIPQGVQTPTSEPLEGGKRGGVLNVAQTEDFEHLDPGQAYFQNDYQITAATQRSQYSYYCTNPAGYYPQVATCPSGWLTVVPNSGSRTAPAPR